LGHNIENKNLENLRTDLLFMDKYTDPHSDIDLFREYATLIGNLILGYPNRALICTDIILHFRLHNLNCLHSRIYHNENMMDSHMHPLNLG
jgi:hypothetical protein